MARFGSVRFRPWQNEQQFTGVEAGRSGCLHFLFKKKKKSKMADTFCRPACSIMAIRNSAVPFDVTVSLNSVVRCKTARMSDLRMLIQTPRLAA